MQGNPAKAAISAPQPRPILRLVGAKRSRDSRPEKVIGRSIVQSKERALAESGGVARRQPGSGVARSPTFHVASSGREVEQKSIPCVSALWVDARDLVNPVFQTKTWELGLDEAVARMLFDKGFYTVGQVVRGWYTDVEGIEDLTSRMLKRLRNKLVGLGAMKTPSRKAKLALAGQSI